MPSRLYWSLIIVLQVFSLCLYGTASRPGPWLGMLCSTHPNATSRQPTDTTPLHHTYAPGWIWFFTWDLNLKVEFSKMALRFVGPFPIAKVVNLVAVTFKLPKSLRINPTFHASKIKPVKFTTLLLSCPLPDCLCSCHDQKAPVPCCGPALPGNCFNCGLLPITLLLL